MMIIDQNQQLNISVAYQAEKKKKKNLLKSE